MDSGREAFPNDIAALKAALAAARDRHIIETARAAYAEAELAVARAKASDDQALIAHQQLGIGMLRCSPNANFVPAPIHYRSQNRPSCGGVHSHTGNTSRTA